MIGESDKHTVYFIYFRFIVFFVKSLYYLDGGRCDNACRFFYLQQQR